MTVKQTNRFLLQSTIISLVMMVGLQMVPFIKACDIDLIMLSEYTVLLIIGLIYLGKNGTKFFDYLPYGVPVKAASLFWIFILVILIGPVSTMLCEIGGWIFGNTFEIAVRFGAIQADTILAEFINVAIIPAVFEELFYRGFFYEGWKRGCGKRAAIITSAICFGTFHMIAQQSLYAIAAGLLLAVIRELTGSMWAGMWFHFLNNVQSVLNHYLEKTNPKIIKCLFTSYYNFENTRNTIIFIAAFVVAVPLIFVVLKKIARIEGKEEEYKTFFKEEKKEDAQKLITVPLILNLLLQCGVMVGMKFLMEYGEVHPEIFGEK